MNFGGIIVGAAVFLIIGICHPIVIKMEYHWGKKSSWVLAQEMRVLRGWFPENPKRHAYYERRRQELEDLGKFPSHMNLQGKLKG